MLSPMYQMCRQHPSTTQEMAIYASNCHLHCGESCGSSIHLFCSPKDVSCRGSFCPSFNPYQGRDHPYLEGRLKSWIIDCYMCTGFISGDLVYMKSNPLFSSHQPCRINIYIYIHTHKYIYRNIYIYIDIYMKVYIYIYP
jgi:hypothetical protein